MASGASQGVVCVMSEAFAVHQQLLENADADVEHAVAEASARARQGAPHWGAPGCPPPSQPLREFSKMAERLGVGGMTPNFSANN